ncbi:HprK-related kinase B [Humidesulfovibrio mexicanus]|uniref:HprK-related kinase B n=1 Tax=Humidesulfovibrio mexicanus TaxID=147047 RepID=A0A239A4M9_9BACT|nr:HprK-related kinase B [Humidesulfovibrio mexicanus]SNR89853.1 HprK-related kinase B [Humidesulfovibrio mexicanus]
MSAAPGFDALAGDWTARFPASFGFHLRLEELSVCVRGNSQAVMDDLRAYFAPFASPGAAEADISVLLLDAPAQEPPVPLAVRPHLPGKRPDKERFADFPGADGAVLGRLVRKQATGMLFLFGPGGPASASGLARNIAIGPCAANRNQLVNFICARYMERRVAQGWLLGHAAGVALPLDRGGAGLALCGFAGMGKSTLALHLAARGLDFLSNDRVLIEPASPGHGPVLHGIPKHPRLNPGTALGNPELAPFLSRALPRSLRAAYANLPPQALYGIEDKFDAIIDECFSAHKPAARSTARGAPGRFRLSAPLAGLAVLNWKHGGGPMRARRVALAERPDLLPALRKPPGVFYLPHALARARLSKTDCLAALSGVPTLELSGGSIFSAATEACLDLLHPKP